MLFAFYIYILLTSLCKSTFGSSNKGCMNNEISDKLIWSWTSGYKFHSIKTGIYGSLGIYSSSNHFGSRKDSSILRINESVVIFGGYGYTTTNNQGFLSDYWMYDYEIDEWMHLFGSKGINQVGIHSLNFNSGGIIGGRSKSSIGGSKDVIYVFGGYGLDCNNQTGFLNDVVEYNFVENSLRWVKGSEYKDELFYSEIDGEFNSQNVINSRYSAVDWNIVNDTHTGHSFLIIFGGYGMFESQRYGIFNDLWVFDCEIYEWKVVKRSLDLDEKGVYVDIGEFSSNAYPGILIYSIVSLINHQGSRIASVGWMVGTYLYLLGGEGIDGNSDYGVLSDLWVFDLESSLFCCLRGSVDKINYQGKFGTFSRTYDDENYPSSRKFATSFLISESELGLFGGVGYYQGEVQYLNDLWILSLNTLQWKWINQPNKGSYGVKGEFDYDNIPPNRISAVGISYTTSINRKKTNTIIMSSGFGPNEYGTIYDKYQDVWTLYKPYCCFGIIDLNTTLVCSGRGNCMFTDTCECMNEYMGDECEYGICNNIKGNDSKVCSMQGKCIDHETCECNLHYYGIDCEESIVRAYFSDSKMDEIRIIHTLNDIYSVINDTWILDEFECSKVIENYEILKNSTCTFAINNITEDRIEFLRIKLFEPITVEIGDILTVKSFSTSEIVDIAVETFSLINVHKGTGWVVFIIMVVLLCILMIIMTVIAILFWYIKKIKNDTLGLGGNNVVEFKEKDVSKKKEENSVSAPNLSEDILKKEAVPCAPDLLSDEIVDISIPTTEPTIEISSEEVKLKILEVPDIVMIDFQDEIEKLKKLNEMYFKMSISFLHVDKKDSSVILCKWENKTTMETIEVAINEIISGTILDENDERMKSILTKEVKFAEHPNVIKVFGFVFLNSPKKIILKDLPLIEFLKLSESLKKDIEAFRKNCVKLDETDINKINKKYQDVKDFLKISQKNIELTLSTTEKSFTKIFDDISLKCNSMILSDKEEFLEKVELGIFSSKKRINYHIIRLKTTYYHSVLKNIQTIFNTKVKVLYQNFLENVEKSKLIEELMRIKLKFEKDIRERTMILMDEEHQYKRLEYSSGFINDKQKSEYKRKLELLQIDINSIKTKEKKNEQIILDNYHKILLYLQKAIDEEYEKIEDPFIRNLKLRSIFVERDINDYAEKEVISSNGLVLKVKYFTKEGVSDLYKWKILKILDFDSRDEKVYTKTKNEILHLLKLKHSSIMEINHIFTYHSEIGITKIGIEMDYYTRDLLFWLKDKPQRLIHSKEEFEKILSFPTKQDKSKIRIVFKKILDGICYIHKEEVEHRDMKPQNVMINDENDENDVRIIDFGISKTKILPIETRYTFKKYEVTERYESPEKKHSKSSDIYAFGKMLFEALVKPEHINLDIQAVSNLKYLKSEEIDVLKKLLEINPSKRITADDAITHPFFKLKNIIDKGYYSIREDRIKSIIESITVLTQKFDIDDVKTIKINRNDVVDDLLNFLIAPAKNLSELMCGLEIDFVNDNGVDVGGLTRVLFSEFTKQIQKDRKKNYLKEFGNYVLPTDKQDCQDIFRMIGKLFCRCYLEKRNLSLSFGPLLYSFILNKPPKTLEDWKFYCRYYDLSFLQSMEKFLPMNDIDFNQFVPYDPESYTFFDIFEGKKRVLSSKTKERYVLLKIKDKLLGTSFRKLNIEAFKDGFYSFLPQNHKVILENFLNPIELEFLIVGVKEISIKKLIENIKSPIFTFLKQWIHQSSNSQRLSFIYCVTGSNTIPYNGKLSKKIEISVQDRMNKSFYSSTCSYTLDIGSKFQSFDEFKIKFDDHLIGFEFSDVDEIF